MLLPDQRFASVVSFVVGFDHGKGRRLLGGFSDWVDERVLGRESTRAWPNVILGAISQGSPSQEEDAVQLLLDLLEEFLRDRPADA